MANTKKDRMALRQAWLARPENKRLWLVFANAILEDNDEEKWIEYPATTIPILLDHMVEQDSVGIIFLRRPPVVVRFEEWTRKSMQRTPNAIVHFLEREVWMKDPRELREVVFKGYNPKYIEDPGKAISLLLQNKELLSCHYGSMDSPIDLYAGLEESNIANDGIEVIDMVEWAPYALLK
jgi:hypothetical protein